MCCEVKPWEERKKEVRITCFVGGSDFFEICGKFHLMIELSNVGHKGFGDVMTCC